MQEIAKTHSHTLVVDTVNNRIYCTVLRSNLLRNSTFFQDWENAKRLVSTGFTVLTDISQMDHISKGWVKTSTRLQRKLLQEGLAGIAEILSEQVAEELKIHQINRIPGRYYYMKEELFTNRKAAEMWLDRISKA